MPDKICVVYSHHKLGDLIWQLPYIKSISEFHNQKITLITREKTQAKDILQDEIYIDQVHYNNFRKKLLYFYEIFLLYNFFKKNKFSHIYVLDKISRPAIAAKLAGTKNILGPGIKNQKKWLTNKVFLKDADFMISYKLGDLALQSKNFLNINGIKVNELIPSINIRNSTLNQVLPQITKDTRISMNVAFGVDSFEDYKMWYEEYFSELSHKLTENKIGNFFYLICGPEKRYIAEKIIKLSNHNNFLDCSNLNLLGIIKVIKNSNIFIGNNSGPLNLSSALGVKTFGLISGTSVSALKHSNIIPVTPKDYVDQHSYDRIEMKKITVKSVLDAIKKNQ